MKPTHLVLKKQGSSLTFHYRSLVPKDLQDRLGQKQFQISLGNNLTYRDSVKLTTVLHHFVQEIFSSIRKGMRDLTIEDIKEILRVEVRKSILYSHQINEQTNKHTDSGIMTGLQYVMDLEKKIQNRVDTDLKSYRTEVEDKLEGILKSLDIKVDRGSVDFRKLRNRFIDLYLMRTSWVKDLLKDNGRTQEDWKREVDEIFGMGLYPEKSRDSKDSFFPSSTQTLTSQPSTKLTSLEQTPVSKVMEDYFEQKGENVRDKTKYQEKRYLNLLIEEVGDIPIGSITREMTKGFKTNIMKLPSNMRKSPKYRDLTYREILKKNIPQKEKLSRTTVNNILSILSSFMEWCKNDHYVKENLFKGMMLKKDIHPRDETKPFTNQDLRTVFNKNTYLDYTIEKRKFHLYWIPLISLFHGLRLGEICPLYCDNIRKIEGNHRERRWCFDIIFESNRPDKRLKNTSSRRIVPIHDTLINLGFLEYVEIVQKKLKKERLFHELTYVDGNYNKSVSRFWNQKYLPDIGLKSSQTNFHSLRHTCSNHLKQKGIPTEFIQELLGHTTGKITLERYGESYNPSILYKKCVSKIIYQTSQKRVIDFLKIKVDWEKTII